MTISNFHNKLRDRIITFLDNNDPNEIIYVKKDDLISEECSSESDFFINYLPKVLVTVEKTIHLDIESIKYRLIGKIIVNPGVSYHG